MEEEEEERGKRRGELGRRLHNWFSPWLRGERRKKKENPILPKGDKKWAEEVFFLSPSLPSPSFPFPWPRNFKGGNVIPEFPVLT